MNNKQDDPTTSNDMGKEPGHSTVASRSSLEDEKQVTFHPQSLGEMVEKVRGESDDEQGLLGTTKKALQEIDRQVSGEYEHREDGD